MKVTYSEAIGNNQSFKVVYDGNNMITDLGHLNDDMNWVREGEKWGEVISSLPLDCEVTRDFAVDALIETYDFQNNTDSVIEVGRTDVGICIPLPDYYRTASECLDKCCHVHISANGSDSYIMALRMNGKGNNLGLILRYGNISGYSVKRSLSGNVSNDRGILILHTEHLVLNPGDSYAVSWELVWFDDKEDFKDKIAKIPGFINVQCKKHILLGDEKASFKFRRSSSSSTPVIIKGEREVSYNLEGEYIWVNEKIDYGEAVYSIYQEGRVSRVSFYALPPLDALAEKRCRFIVENQQCMDEDSFLYGAYLIYDNEEKKTYYSPTFDHNGGRERICMGILIAKYLQKHIDYKMRKSLDLYEQYVLRELFDENTGEVFNDAGRNNGYIRLYNYPWMTRFWIEMYRLKNEDRFISYMVKCIDKYFATGGGRFYPIELPIYDSVMLLKELGQISEADRITALYETLGDFLLEKGVDYPESEVSYEQSIVAPAAMCLKELYFLTKKEKYKEGAKLQFKMLDLFHGFQPNYHQNEVAIRHWDGYWFGKRKCLGDTFPHYWSALSGCAFYDSEEIMDTDKYSKRAENILRGPLSMFNPDGSATCAFVYPETVNGEVAHFSDPWANDQDWGLYFMLKYFE